MCSCSVLAEDASSSQAAKVKNARKGQSPTVQLTSATLTRSFPKMDLSSMRGCQKQELRISVQQHNRHMAVKHRMVGTGVSYLSDRPGHGLEPSPFAKFLDFHLPKPVIETNGNRVFKILRSSAEDRVRSFTCSIEVLGVLPTHTIEPAIETRMRFRLQGHPSNLQPRNLLRTG